MTKPVSQFKQLISSSLTIWAQRALQAQSVDSPPILSENALETSNECISSQLPLPVKINLWSLELRLFEKAIKLNDINWQFYYMKAIVLGKLKGDPKEIMSCSLKSIDLLPADSGTKEQEKIWDVHIFLFTCALKWHKRGILVCVYYLPKLNWKPYNENEMKEKLNLKWLNDVSIDHKSLELSQFILQELQKIQSSDKKKWQHRVTFRVNDSWNSSMLNIIILDCVDQEFYTRGPFLCHQWLVCISQSSPNSQEHDWILEDRVWTVTFYSWYSK